MSLNSFNSHSKKNDTEEKPNFEVPSLACDTHFHVFGPKEKFPYGSELRYTPPLAPLENYLALADQLNMERMVFIQPSAYGKDNTCMLEAMYAVGDNCRGIVDIDDDAPEEELERLNALGVRGIRINVSPYKTYEAGFSQKIISRVKPLAERAKRIGWHVQFLSPGWLVQELIPTLRELPIPYVIDHMGLFPAKNGIEQPGFRELLRLLGEGQCWVKLTGVYRMSTDIPEFKDAAPFAQALVDTAPDRILWGSDYPHLTFDDKVDSLSLFNLLKVWVPDPTQRKKILVDNPINLFGFDKA